MSSMSPVDADGPRPQPSLPPSPSTEQDLSGAHRWSDDEADHLDPSSKTKGKARQLYNADEEVDDEESDLQEYPPANDDEAETRRVEENLKRWEVAERMKRKAVREAQADSPAPSFIADVGRRASALWAGSRQSQQNASLGTHAALQSRESVDVVPLDDIAATPTPSPTHSVDPFANPPSPFGDAQAEAVMSSVPPTPQLEGDDATALMSPAPERPALLTASSSFRRPPTPKPLGLPPPRVPPPPLPQNTPPPVPVPSQADDEPRETRWWHDWLCGFGEGADRGGDNQAGRTNPFE
ncbi:hypothetical protein B0H10DRAFT_2062613 [Mycena sp. CBHHK59/15]|nr:hypothetical protein B0H10DRAFT_2062613 [Mycena sp. CBHHK59/15]